MASLTLGFKIDEEKLIIEELKKIFVVVSQISKSELKIISRLEVKKNGSVVFLTFYSTGKCLIQGSDGELSDSLKQFTLKKGLIELNAEKKTKYLSELDETNFYKEKNFIVGFDEAGTGETIGSAVFVAVILPKEKLSVFGKLRKDIKSLSPQELNYYCELIKKQGIQYGYVTASPYEISNCGLTKNRLMDKKYVELIRKLSSWLNKDYILMLDDYGVREDITSYLKNLDKQGIKSICRDKLDENITACKLASIIARQMRYSEVFTLEKNNRLQFNGKEISFGKGANDEKMDNWLRAFRTLNPTQDFPDFVKKSFRNVKKIEEEIPRKIIPLHFDCKECNSRLKRIFAYHTTEEDKSVFLLFRVQCQNRKIQFKNSTNSLYFSGY